ncbi:hypothetical protein A4A49_01025 [Nicotiana attenuata]|uniref:Uncharacterized protein n=1 Tax=Nicotiana attenuata TaxID=49451 RepID=A0A1J6IEE4_NICAT|nr:hypothetical protein A4A49_01025 [Nicotiana attenuata]
MRLPPPLLHSPLVTPQAPMTLFSLMENNNNPPSQTQITTLLTISTTPMPPELMPESWLEMALQKIHPEPPNDGLVGPNGDNHPKSQVPSSTSHTASPPGSEKLWTPVMDVHSTPVMDVHSTPSPVHEAATTLLCGGTQHTHGPTLPDNALLPTHESGGSTPISIIPTLATNVQVPQPPPSQPLSPIDLLSRGTTMALDYLRESNVDLENILKKLGMPKTKAFLMHEPLEIEFKE